MKTQSRLAFQKGFTLIELMIAITIVVILAGLSFSGFEHIQRKQKDEKARVQIHLLDNAIESYFTDTGKFPDSISGTQGLFNELYGTPAATQGAKVYLADLNPEHNNQKWIKTIGTSHQIIDPFGSEFIYRTGESATNPDFDLISMGVDKKLDSSGSSTKDDITNF